MPGDDVEITARFTRDELSSFSIPALEYVPKFTIGAKTDMGRVREHNEDRYEFYIPDTDDEKAGRGCVFMVCDGMGGHSAGQVASELACKTFIGEYYGKIVNAPADGAKTAALAANRYIYDVAQTIRSYDGMGTTLTALILCQCKITVAHVGDSRCYRVRDNKITMLTDDHTWVNEQITKGLMSNEDAELSPFAHVITRACGIAPAVEVDIIEDDLKPGDTFLLCSDGLTNHVADDELETALRTLGPSAGCNSLVKMALDRGGSDNCTLIIVRVDSVDKL